MKLDLGGAIQDHWSSGFLIFTVIAIFNAIFKNARVTLGMQT